ncbi:MAG: tryptophan-rich sensory protein [Cyclobacteriaceae bacterium]|nr:tryptophan-rich sensory protein [Cyclobacteriaceae bacterium SS2]
MIIRLLVFLLINFGALAIGSQFTRRGVASEWYAALIKAPWSPPGWTFGVAWFSIMICYSIYMAISWKEVSNQKLLLVFFVLQLILNVSWNPVFFHLQNPAFALVIITALTFLMVGFLFYFRHETRQWSLLILPYVLWLLIATSLNGYIVFNN